jgi:AcrR family transcriptional regulator
MLTQMQSRTRQKEETRSKIVETATRLCGTGGFTGLRTAEVAREAGLSHGAIFVHFPSREDLVLAVAARIGREITDRLHALATRRASLRQVLRAHLRCLAEAEDAYRSLVLEWSMQPEGVRTAWVALQSAVSFHLLEVAEREMEAGRARRMPLHLFFNTWIALVHHYLVNRELFSPGASVLERHGETLVRHYLALVATKKKGVKHEPRRPDLH